MSGKFDPYHRWLGIPPRDQPASHYRLLGLELFEGDPEVIRDAAERQMAHVRTYQLGPQSELSQEILNELGAAKACLLQPSAKAAYDRQLADEQWQTQLKRQSPAGPIPPTPPESRSVSWKDPRVVLGVWGLGVLSLLVLALLTFALRSQPPGSNVGSDSITSSPAGGGVRPRSQRASRARRHQKCPPSRNSKRRRPRSEQCRAWRRSDRDRNQ
jgi:hypothetical protein